MWKKKVDTMDTRLPTTWTFPPTHTQIFVTNTDENTKKIHNRQTQIHTKGHKAANNLDFSTHSHYKYKYKNRSKNKYKYTPGKHKWIKGWYQLGLFGTLTIKLRLQIQIQICVQAKEVQNKHSANSTALTLTPNSHSP